MMLFSLSQLFAADVRGLRTVVIDPGHGGKDPGAVSPDGKYQEKNITLEVAMTLSEKIRAAYPDVKVVLTRTDDRFVTLNKRAEIANRNGADLFISVHINSASSTSAHGFSSHVMGRSQNSNTDLYNANLQMVRRENSVILLDDDYNKESAGFDPSDPESYIFMTMVQNAYLEQSIKFACMVTETMSKSPVSNTRGMSQDPFYVLWKTSMPSVLLELGFISNKDDLKILLSKDGKEKISDCIFEAFSLYKKDFDKSMEVHNTEPVKPVAESKPVVTEEIKGDVKYGVQVFTVSSRIPDGDSRLLGYKALAVQSGKFYRYIISVDSDLSKVRKNKEKIASRYPDCFIVKIEGDKISRAN